MSATSPKYRPDIDGLRAIAVAAVIAFHAWPLRVPGGFTGVDIFFVISGYLITGVIAGELSSNTFSLSRFYQRRVRRIFPALATMLIAATLAAWMILLPDEWRSFGKHLFAGAAFVSNLALTREGGYFDWTAQHKPLLHLWSLGVEEQFYFVWPLLLAMLWKTRVRIRIALLALIVLASFVINAWGVTRYPVYTFYLPVTRLWELGIGSLMAVIGTRRVTERRALAEFASWSGIAFLIASLVFIRESTAFPGWWALPPVLGAALTIAAGPQALINRVVLSSRAFVFIGLISYPLYLWHWPLLSFARIAIRSELSALTRIALIAIAFVLATLTYRFIETPIRRVTTFSTKLRVVCATLAVLAAFGWIVYARRINARLSSPAIDEFLTATHAWEYPYGENFGRTSNFVRSTVPGNAPGVVLFIGDSHLEQYWSRIDAVRTRTRVPELWFATNAGCPPIPELGGSRGDVCAAWLAFALREARDPRVTRIVLGAYWQAYLGATPTSAGLAALQRLGDEIRSLTAMGKRVYVILPGPTSAQLDPRATIDLAHGEIVTSPVPLREILDASAGTRAALREFATTAGAIVIDPLPVLCPNAECPRFERGHPIYRDSTHLHPSYAREHATYIDRVLTD